MNAPVEKPVDPLWLAEFSCWTMVALAPLLYWVNGPAVSVDQLVVRCVVFGSALAGGIGLRVYKTLRRRG
ncbi:MAG TPA: hypothetical protein EYP56_18110 [Planctomycetaceae bacterium]|nr:hypothetical protein [Planctomycetaceae bacterium]HIQ21987.1 hypothetical protein [Planctomycetota bacterium]